jgi:hypothetical protein
VPGVKGDGGFVPGQGVGTGLVEITGGVRTVFVSQMEPSGSRPCSQALASRLTTVAFTSPPETACAENEDVLPPLPQVCQHGGRALGALELQAQHVALAVEADAHGEVHGIELNR